MKKDYKVGILLTGILICYLCLGVYIQQIEIPIRWLFWNLFLAMVPFYVSLTILFFQKIKYIRWLIIPILLILWILFLPNSFYMLTDLIHLNGSHLIIDTSIGLYSSDLAQWVRILYITGGILIGMFSGVYSTVVVYRFIIPKKFHLLLSGIFSLIISFLVGYGVYIGRFLRLNTWDVLHPRALIKVLLTDFNKFTIKFSVMIAFIFFICFIVLLLLVENSYFKASKKSS